MKTLTKVNGCLKMNKINLSLLKTPPSTQHAYVNRAVAKSKMIRFLSKEAKEYKELIRNAFLTKYGSVTDDKSFFGNVPLEVEIHLNFPTAHRKDFDNYHKVTGDALEGLVYDDDSQIVKATIYKESKSKTPGYTITIWPFIKD